MNFVFIFFFEKDSRRYNAGISTKDMNNTKSHLNIFLKNKTDLNWATMPQLHSVISVEICQLHDPEM